MRSSVNLHDPSVHSAVTVGRDSRTDEGGRQNQNDDK
jgi:hypothetical protein